jgi:hypothetical protein
MAFVLGRNLGRMIIYCSLLSMGCSQQAWYEGFQESERQKCYEIVSQSAIQQCIDNVNSMSYHQYQREREGLNKNSH